MATDVVPREREAEDAPAKSERVAEKAAPVKPPAVTMVPIEPLE